MGERRERRWRERGRGVSDSYENCSVLKPWLQHCAQRPAISHADTIFSSFCHTYIKVHVLPPNVRKSHGFKAPQVERSESNRALPLQITDAAPRTKWQSFESLYDLINLDWLLCEMCRSRMAMQLSHLQHFAPIRVPWAAQTTCFDKYLHRDRALLEVQPKLIANYVTLFHTHFYNLDKH